MFFIEEYVKICYNQQCMGVDYMLEKQIEELQLNAEINKVLKKNKINKVKQLTNKTKTQLKEISLLALYQ